YLRLEEQIHFTPVPLGSPVLPFLISSPLEIQIRRFGEQIERHSPQNKNPVPDSAMSPSQPALDQWSDTAHGPQKHQDSTQSPKFFSGRVIVRGRGVGESPDKARARAGNPI